MNEQYGFDSQGRWAKTFTVSEVPGSVRVIERRETPWDARARELEEKEGPYCVYAAWKEWFEREVEAKLPEGIGPILDALGPLGDIYLFDAFEKAANGDGPGLTPASPSLSPGASE